MNNNETTQTENLNNTQSVLMQVVSFKLGNEEFGVEILKVQEIIKVPEITKLPNSPEYVEGIINLRGKIIPVVDLRKRLGLENSKKDDDPRIIVVNIAEKTIGFIVDEVREVLWINSDKTEQPPSIIAGIQSDYITSVAKLENRLLILLDLEKVLTQEELEAID